MFFGIFWNFKKFDVVYLISEEAKKVTIRQTGLTHVPPDTLMLLIHEASLCRVPSLRNYVRMHNEAASDTLDYARRGCEQSVCPQKRHTLPRPDPSSYCSLHACKAKRFCTPCKDVKRLNEARKSPVYHQLLPKNAAAVSKTQ